MTDALFQGSVCSGLLVTALLKFAFISESRIFFEPLSIIMVLNDTAFRRVPRRRKVGCASGCVQWLMISILIVYDEMRPCHISERGAVLRERQRDVERAGPVV